MNEVKDSIEAAEKVGSTLSSLIPQLFFDLIARLIPGLVIIWSFYLAFYGNTLIDLDKLVAKVSNILPKNDFFLFCITVVLFYVSSILFYGLWAAVVRVLKPTLDYIGLCTKNSFVEVMETSHEYSFRHDYIKLKAPVAGNRITKLKAEIHMSGALTAAYLICFLISLTSFLYSTLDTAEYTIRSIFFLLGLIGFFFSNHHFTRRLHCSVGSYSVLLNYENDKYRFPDLGCGE